MPLGDSITSAEDGHASYRFWLWNLLEDAGFNVDFVGTQNGVYGGSPAFESFDQDHEGHWGWRTDQILDQVGEWIAVHDPEVVLVHLGHNDLFYDQGVDSTVEELRQVIDEMRGFNPEIVVFLAQLIPGTPEELDPIGELNERIRVLALSMTSVQSPVIAVDHWSGFHPEDDTYDGTHPNVTGEKKIAVRWYSAMVAIDGLLERSSLPRPRTVGRKVSPVTKD